MTAALAASLALALAVREPRPPQPAAPTTAQPADATAASPAASDAGLKDAVDTYLSTIDRPITADRWRALGPGAVPILAAVARDPAAFPSRRAKAVTALGALGGAQAQKAVLDLARDAGAPFGVRASALESAGQVLPAGDLAKQLRPVMQGAHEAPLRAVAANVLSRHAPASTCGAVRAQAAKERPGAREAFSEALSRCASQ